MACISEYFDRLKSTYSLFYQILFGSTVLIRKIETNNKKNWDENF